MASELSRDTAYKVPIRAVTGGTFSKSDSRWEPSYVVTPKAERVSRVRVMGTAVSRFVGDEQKYASITIDDGTDTIAVRAFREDVGILAKVRPGDIVDVIGRVKEYEGEMYINVESVRRIEDPNWELVRRLELLVKGYELSSRELPGREEVLAPVGTHVVEEEVVGEDPKVVLLNLIEEFDDGGGVKYMTLQKESGLGEEELDTVLKELMGAGDVYEPKIGRFKRV